MSRRTLTMAAAVALTCSLVGAPVASAASAPTAAPKPATAPKPTATPAPTPAAPRGTTQDGVDPTPRESLRNGPTRERFYFVMADRFANGDTRNDRGGLRGDRLKTGFDPSHKGFFHGGDLAGLRGKLDYIKGMGTTAIWLTPSFKNKPVQGPAEQESAGYHGYWVTDFTQIDPHFGTNAEMKALIADAHAKGMKVYFDIITNHTADVITYEENRYDYAPKAKAPYRDASGRVFDDRDYAGTSLFPKLDRTTSFPLTPTFATEADKTVKVPAWLNDPTMYHNRGNTTFEGENSLYGDFFGLDDLFTERPEVVEGMGDIYSAWIDLGIDGFRIDTTRHVNMEFWQQFSPRMLQHAAGKGKKDFFMFGEVADPDPAEMSRYTTRGTLPATLDFGFQKAAQEYVAGGPAAGLAAFYRNDDLYTDANSNAYSLPTFTGNHDMGRLPYLLNPGEKKHDRADLLRRVRLANELMFLTRGQPVVYYGDEQGFIGTGNDQAARQDMFTTKTDLYAKEPNLTGPAGARDRFDPSAPLYRQIADLSALREEHPALADGAQITRLAPTKPGVFAVSRVGADRREYVVAVNNSAVAQKATIQTYDARKRFAPVHGTSTAVRSNKTGAITVTVPPMSATVHRAASPIGTRRTAPAVRMASTWPVSKDGRMRVAANVSPNRFVQATFYARRAGQSTWTLLGTDDNGPYQVFHDTTHLRPGTRMEYRVVVKDESGRTRTASAVTTIR
ncbi:alpha-amylase family glycosyl hydrolase [Mobilicoccus pelagius]|uniref:Putative alpha-amylase/pullulanase n=1 Tax=Mobilicoccus pelagius NBRC 104925 TaxID=1089455 RepID=H5UQV9_9MICO|nr:alpha-amylase family glycosyl hydrolase [Mobilicoccus pelagius]GAB48117.1 putative alpha-amylase/pullulanase [Mobilicoccus pelagius NBRC 104925]